MDDTGQPQGASAPAPETAPAPMSVDDAAQVFKAYDANPARDDGEAPAVPRQADGKFAPRTPPQEEQEIETPDAEAQAASDEGADAQDEGEDTEADVAADADDTTDEVPPLPPSWSKEKAEIWEALPPEAQAYITQRDGEVRALITTRTQETANARKVAEAIQATAQNERSQALAITEAAMSLLQPQLPPESMLDPMSEDYNPDTYHLLERRARDQSTYLQQLEGHRQYLADQSRVAAQQSEMQHAAYINEATLPQFVQAYPEAIDQAKAETFYGGLVKFAIDAGAPEDFFLSGPITAVEWHMIADAKKWRDHQAALSKVKTGQRPAPRAPQPAVRPGVTTPRSAVQASKKKAAMDRLSRTGSLEDAAAVFKNL